VPPRAQRQEPLHQQIAKYLTQQILDGELSPGQRVPPVRDLARDWGVSQPTAQHAVELLRSARLVETSNQGTVVAPPRNTPGPQQMVTAARFPAGQSVDMRAAEMIPAPAYIRPVLGMGTAESGVIRREWVTYDETGPARLSVAWVPGIYAGIVPELYRREPLPDPRGEAYLVAERAGLEINWGEEAREARPVLDDGREGPLLSLGPDAHVLAETFKLGSGELVLGYTEFIVRENRVIVTELALPAR
jgi:GntR family transcriptional regulator